MNRLAPVPLGALLERLSHASVDGALDVAVERIEVDSRAVRRGDLFVALRGEHTDGHRYIADALNNGASGVVVEESNGVAPPPGAAIVRVPDTKRALSLLAAARYGDPSARLHVIGVTGTNGKTTTTRMLSAILNAAGIACGVIGTVGAEYRENHRQLRNTTPLPHELQDLLWWMALEDAKAVAMEVSSHALALGRVDDVRFSVAVLTNVTRDHLDFHENVEAYRAAKRRLFAIAPRCVLNLDDECGALWAAELQAQGRETITYGTAAGATLVARDVRVDSEGTGFTLDGRRFELRLSGRFNVSNALAAIGAARFLGVSDEVCARGLAALTRVPGRMERLHGNGVDVVVDYAHTPDALENALRALRETTAGSLIVVFGCGGDRDRGKRAEMGAVAAHLADRIVLADDNPRSEDPRTIMDDILAGIGENDRVLPVGDRRMAIRLAIEGAKPGDVVLVAGKGHENYQIVGERTLPFDDAAIAREMLATVGA